MEYDAEKETIWNKIPIYINKIPNIYYCYHALNLNNINETHIRILKESRESKLNQKINNRIRY